jgi:ribonuclease D
VRVEFSKKLKTFSDSINFILNSMDAPVVVTVPPPYTPPMVPACRAKSGSVEKLQFAFIDEDGEALESALNFISRSSTISVDCEGVKLERSGELCLIQIATTFHVFLFDVASLGPVLFDKGLRSILQSPSIVKVFYDCRGDSDILYHQYGVELRGVLDVALTEVFYRWTNGLGTPRYLKGYKKSVETYLQVTNPNFYALKEKVSALMTSSGAACWRERPLPKDMLEYAAYDVKYMRDLHLKLIANMGKRDLQTLYSASNKFISMKRDNHLDKGEAMSVVSPDLFNG